MNRPYLKVLGKSIFRKLVETEYSPDPAFVSADGV